MRAKLEGDALKVLLRKITKDRDEQVIVECYEVSDEVKSIVRYIKSADTVLAGYLEDKV
jgi:hypothetical protein